MKIIHTLGNVFATFLCLFVMNSSYGGWMFETEVVDDTANVGIYNSIALDKTGLPQIAYYDSNNGDLKYAAMDNSLNWSTSTLDSTGDVGLYCGITTGSNDVPQISYCSSYQRVIPYIGTVIDLGKLQYISGSSGTPVIADGDQALYAQYSAIALNNSGEPRVAYQDASTRKLFYVEKTGSTWGTCEEIEDGGNGASIAIDNLGRAHIAHVDSTVLRYTYWNGSNWVGETVEDYAVDDERTAIALDSNGYPRIVFVNSEGLYYAFWDGSSWHFELVHYIPDGGAVGISSPSLALNSSDEPFISYHGNIWGNLAVVVAVRESVNHWTIPVWLMQNTTPVGQTSIAIDTNDMIHVSFHDASTGDLGYAKLMADYDDDWLPDWWEMKWFNDLDEVFTGDPDGDNWDNAYEYELGTDPTVSDIESWDRDGDGLGNDDETNIYGTDPDDADSDDDGLPDGVEVGYHVFWESFEDATIDGSVWTTGGSQAWTINTNESSHEIQSARAGTISDEQSSYIEVSAVLQGKGIIAFAYKTSCSTNGDALSFSTNGAVQSVYSGQHSWTMHNVPNINKGTNTFRWTYEKDSGGSEGDDTAWIDAVYVGVDSTGTSPTNSDCDADGLLDGEEINTYDTNPNNKDSDGDGIEDGAEINTYRTDPTNMDSDNDLMPDGWEVDNTLNPTNSADASNDIEPDGLTNLEEYQNGTNPRVADSDSDSMPDKWEVDNTLNPTNSADASNDIEPDGLTNLEEYQNGTNPRSADSDSDKMPDGWEVDNTLNPTNATDAASDIEPDGLTNLEEFHAGTNPRLADTDNDGIPDGWETEHGLNPIVDDTEDDADNDGLTNLEEYQNGTNPNTEDTDADGLKDSTEVNVTGTNPIIRDTDADGLPDGQETEGTGVICFGFEDGALPQGTVLSGDSNWTVAQTNTVQGQRAACSGAIYADWQNSKLDCTIETASGTGSFWYRVAVAPNNEFEFFVNGSRKLYRYEASWTNYTFSVFEGTNVFAWNFLTRSGGTLTGGEGSIIDLLTLPVTGTGSCPTNSDTDADGLSDGTEVNTHGTDPDDSDSDNDGLSDGEEINLHNTDPNNADCDSDGLSDGEEINTYDTLPLDSDTDNDGLTDGEEINTYNCNPKSTDSDGDTLQDGDEVKTLGTDPAKRDTDDDGLDDNVETDTGTFVSSTDTGTDPLDDDTDDDGALDGIETDTGIWISGLDWGTDPFDTDTDADGLDDGAETHTGIYSNALNAGSNPHLTDTDNDTLPDGDEVHVHNTDPNKADTDDDGLTDPDEINTHNTNPSDPDSDDDGLNDGDEIYNLTEFRESFEENKIPDGWTTGGYAGWQSETNDVYDGTNSIVSGTIYEGYESWIQLSIKTWTNNLTFYNSTYGYWGDDDFEVRVDGSLKYTVSGDRAWHKVSIPLTAGEHTIQWKYSRDCGYYVPGGARALIDLVEIMQWDSTDPHDTDRDDDGVSDGDEVHTYGTSPNNVDSDNDGMDDGYEVDNLLNPRADDANDDPDSDGLNNGDEHLYGSNAQVKDSDGDGIEDGTEVHTYGSNPMDTDSDDDGLEDGDEVTYSTGLVDDDSDDDGVKDGAEVYTHGTEPTMFDTDSDGLSDGDELIGMIYSNSFEKTYFDYRWSTGEDVPWGISTSWPYDGSQHAFSTELYLETNVVSLTLNTANGNIQFAELVAMQTGGKARFYINGIQQEIYFQESFGWGWVQKSYSVSQGTNTFTWIVENWSSASGYFAIDKLSIPMLTGTSALDDDSDDDGVKDGLEVNLYDSNPLNTDTDSDGLTDGEEVNTYGTNPNLTDSDLDGMQDKWEIDNSLMPTNNIDAAMDIEPDGLTNLEEYQNGTNPRIADTDSDGMLDGYEVNNGLNPLLDDADLDLDNDGLTNLEEHNAGTNPQSSDTDSDSMPDKWEVDNSLMPTNNADATMDIEPDGLTNLEEYQNGTNPRIADTDNDNMPDGWEVDNSLMPTNNTDAAVDIEPDGLTNLEEYQNDTNPRVADSDSDNMPDGYEVNHGLNPLVNDRDDDLDGDTLTNIEEYQNGTHPGLMDTDQDGLRDDYEINTSHTDPTDADSDDDGMGDGYEVDNYLNPLDGNDASGDSDRDGLTNLEEYQLGTNPLDTDSDDDEMPDKWEYDNGLNPIINDAGGDPDKDGFTNKHEYDNQTSPNDADSSQTSGYFRIVSDHPTVITDFTPDGWISWSNSVPSGTCTIQRATSLIASGTQSATVSGEISRMITPDETNTWLTYAQHSVTSSTTSTRCYDPRVANSMQYIPAGEFTMGDHFDDGLHWDEKPEHRVYLSPYYIGKYEITNEQMIEVLQWAREQGKIGINGDDVQYTGYTILNMNDDCRITWNGSIFELKDTKSYGYPCIFVSWYGAVAYCNLRSEMENLEPCYNYWRCDHTMNGYRLPTEAQWEKAARGGLQGFRFAWNDVNIITHNRANYNSTGGWMSGLLVYTYDESATLGYHPKYDEGDLPYTSPIGSFEANGYGLYDMTGNVAEWCNDWYDRTYYANSPSSNPYGPTATSGDRVVRGGSWNAEALFNRVSCREMSETEGSMSNYIGFRVVLPEN
jgi:formylglycine-generating enzyme required for sulfatase activity